MRRCWSACQKKMEWFPWDSPWYLTDALQKILKKVTNEKLKVKLFFSIIWCFCSFLSRRSSIRTYHSQTRDWFSRSILSQPIVIKMTNNFFNLGISNLIFLPLQSEGVLLSGTRLFSCRKQLCSLAFPRDSNTCFNLCHDKLQINELFGTSDVQITQIFETRKAWGLNPAGNYFLAN